MWSDNETKDDYLNFRCVAKTAAELIHRADGSPLSLGVSGSWGAGKSSMLNLIADALKARDEHQTYLFVNFNAWLYQGYDDARAALLEEITKKLNERAKGNETALEKIQELLEQVDWLRLFGFAAGSVAALSAGALPAEASLLATQVMLGSGANNNRNNSYNNNSGKNTETNKRKTPPQQIHVLRKNFEEALSEMDVTLVVFIDDLDRCLPDTAISTLEAMRLFLFLPRTAFIIAADDKMIRQAVRVHFKGAELDDNLVTNYFDKLIQIPLRVPLLGTQEVRAYLMLLYINKAGFENSRMKEIRDKVCNRLSASWSGNYVDLDFINKLVPDMDSNLRTNLELADRLAHLMTTAKQINGNPRLIKRFLNTLWIRLAVAESQEVTVDESTLAKVLLFERCAEEVAYQRLMAAVNNSPEGKPLFLVDWEQQARSGGEITELDRDWNTPFVRGWLALEPPLGELDLRSVMHISRETLPIVTAADQMSPEALKLLEEILKLKAERSTYTERLQALSSRDHQLMFDRLMFRARQEQSWGIPDVLWAFLALIEAAPDMGMMFGKFLKNLAPKHLKPAIIPTLSKKNWAQSAIDSWAENPKTSKQVKNAINSLRSKIT